MRVVGNLPSPVIYFGFLLDQHRTPASKYLAPSEEPRLQNNATATQRSLLTSRLTSERTTFLNLYLISVLIGVCQALPDRHAASVNYEPVERIV
jgi:hypothetical protein